MDSVDSREMTLGDGRVLAFAEYGDPSGPPIFYFHGFPGCRATFLEDEGHLSRLDRALVDVLGALSAADPAV